VEDGLRTAFAVALDASNTETVVAGSPGTDLSAKNRSVTTAAGELPVAASEADWLKQRLPVGAKPAALTSDLAKGDTLTLTLRDHVRTFEIISVRHAGAGAKLEIFAKSTGADGQEPRMIRFTVEADALPSLETRRVGWWATDRETL
jgi:hypothetical protein